MTYNGHSTRSTNRILTILVVAAIAIVAMWAITGGFDQIQASEPPALESE